MKIKAQNTYRWKQLLKKFHAKLHKKQETYFCISAEEFEIKHL